MNRFFKTLVAGYGAKKLGGGCFSTILVFIVIYWALGTCNCSPQAARQGSIQEAPLTSGQQDATVNYHR